MSQDIRFHRTTNSGAPALLWAGEPSVELGATTRFWLGDGGANRLLLSDNPADLPRATRNYLPLTGGTLSGGLGFGSTLAAAPENTSRHITLWAGPSYGFNITSGSLNVVANGVRVLGITSPVVNAYAPIALPADPASPLHASTKQYVDAVQTSLGNYLPLSGGVMSGGIGFGADFAATAGTLSRHLNLHTAGYGISVTNGALNLNAPAGALIGFAIAGSGYRATINSTGLSMSAGTTLTLAGAPGLPNQAANRQYVDDRTVNFPFVPIAGGTMGGQLTTLPPTLGGHATNKTYVDGQIANLRLFKGTWRVSTNVPPLPGIGPPREGVGDYYIAVTAVNTAPERPPAGIPGLPTTSDIHNGDIVIWNDGASVYELIQGGPLTYADAEGMFVNKSGDIMSGGLSFGGATAPGNDASNLSRHITLYAGTSNFGFSITSGRLNIVNTATTDRVVFVNSAADVAQVGTAGITLLNNRDVILARNPPADATGTMMATPRQYVDARAWQEAPNNAFVYGRIGAAWARVPAITFKLADTNWNLNTIPTDFIGWYQIATQTTPVNFPPGVVGNYGMVFNGYTANANWRSQIFLGAANATTDIAPIWIRGGTGAGAFNTWTRIITAAGGNGSTFTGPVTLPGAPTLPNHAATMAYADTKLTQATADTLYLRLATGGTVLGPTIFAGANPSITINGPTGGWRTLQFNSTNVPRWTIQMNTVDDLAINRANDAGTWQGPNFTIARATGLVTMSAGLNVTVGNFDVGAGIATVGANNRATETRIAINAAGSQNRMIEMLTNGARRWIMYAGGGEPGVPAGNAGSDFSFDRYVDTGGRVVVWGANRNTGMVTFASGVTLTGAFDLTLARAPSLANHATTKAYVDGLASNPVGAGTWGRLSTGAWQRVVALSGDTMTGALTVNGVISSPNVASFPAGINYGNNAIRFNWLAGAVDLTVDVTRIGAIATREWVNGLGFLTTTTGDARYLQLTGGTLTGTLNVGTGAAAQELNVVGQAGVEHNLSFRTGAVVANSLRWRIHTSNEAETGGNAGTNLYITRFNDSGAWMNDRSLVISRATGLATVSGDPTAPLGIATKQYADTKLTQAVGDTRYLTPAAGDARYLQLTGGAMTGQIIQPFNPTVSSHLANKNYVDALVANLRLFLGTWQVAANIPNISAVGGNTAGDYYIAVTANPNVPENAPVGTPGIAGQQLHNGDMVIWNAGGSTYQIVRGSPLTKVEADSYYQTPAQANALYLRLVGGTLSGGLGFGGAAQANAWDLTRHLLLHTSNYGISVTASRLNLVGGPGSSVRVVIGNVPATADVAGFSATGMTLYQGDATLFRDPTLPLHAATKAYVDAHPGTPGNWLPLSGGTLTGMLTLSATAPTLANHATNKTYVDAQVATRITQGAADARYVNLTGDTMTGPLTVGGAVTSTTNVYGQGVFAFTNGSWAGSILGVGASANDYWQMTVDSSATLYTRPIGGGAVQGTGVTLTYGGMLAINSSGADPLHINSPNYARAFYTVSGVRRWSLGCWNDAWFRLTDESAGSVMCAWDLVGDMFLTRNMLCNGVLAAGLWVTWGYPTYADTSGFGLYLDSAANRTISFNGSGVAYPGWHLVWNASNGQLSFVRGSDGAPLWTCDGGGSTYNAGNATVAAGSFWAGNASGWFGGECGANSHSYSQNADTRSYNGWSYAHHFQVWSDLRTKEDVHPYEAGLAEVRRLSPVLSRRKLNLGTPHNISAAPEPVASRPSTLPSIATLIAARRQRETVSFIAQDVEKVLPEAVSRNAVMLDDELVHDVRAISIDTILAASVNAIKELAARLEALEARA